MPNHQGLSRVQAARWISQRIGHRLSHSTLAEWETSGLLRARGRGRRRPSAYLPTDLIRAELIARNRQGGVAFEYPGLRALLRVLPEAIRPRAAMRLTVADHARVTMLELAGPGADRL